MSDTAPSLTEDLIAIISRHIEQPRKIEPGDLLVDLGIIQPVHLLTLQCDIEDTLIGHELPGRTVKDSMTVAELAQTIARAREGRPA
jgi:hypothetical protein